LFITTSSPGNETVHDTIEFILSDAEGHWLGKGLGSVNSMLVPYKRNIKFHYMGIYTFGIQQGMRQDDLRGIVDIGMRIQPHF
jgi:gliding motility-associated lipoprotein GldH